MTKSALMSSARPLTYTAPDGYLLAGHCWMHARAQAPVVIINPATSVVSRYYARFAAYLNLHGYHVMTYDYRGIGGSRHGSLRDLRAGWLDWGELDFEAALLEAKRRFPDSQVHAVGHSVGGVLIGLAPSNHLISRVFTMGAQHAYWPDYLGSQRWAMRLRWHVVMPALTKLFGYFPGKRLGWLEDTPAGVVQDWVAPAPDFVDTYLVSSEHRGFRGSRQLTLAQCDDLRRRFAQMTAPTLAFSITDDPYGTVPAIERLLANFSGSQTSHLRLAPDDIGVNQIGHFGFFHGRFEQTLWPIALHWLQHGQVKGPFRTHLVLT
ncbi:MAG: alpha/beta fold hydrolase [Burkholderiaceae bacterium]|nr:alpha/beta fold hydrolase [Burkholderiaceae bacterium]MCD8517869.1 alpha/beta fold hydrolase [Burkholderiaceae bacterium]MCD8538306.1 alpha/beta fold hydrolase [Burkholderiaceae bacterium]MCD8564900.1 alpha/beta fold hydrolase [Burkholderiaceae bacterium]